VKPASEYSISIVLLFSQMCWWFMCQNCELIVH